MQKAVLVIAAAVLLSATSLSSLAQDATESPSLSFFITSSGPGDGANLGGLAGADLHCRALAESVGVEGRTWRAYLSAVGTDSTEAVHARDRIGPGPWVNAKGIVVATDVEHLHSDENALTKETALDEFGEQVNGRGDDPNRHDILTGSTLDGRVSDAEGDTTCGNWTGNGEGSALVGHHDRQGGGANPTSWNSAHGSRGCGQADLQGTGGDGLFYCFAID